LDLYICELRRLQSENDLAERRNTVIYEDVTFLGLIFILITECLTCSPCPPELITIPEGNYYRAMSGLNHCKVLFSQLRVLNDDYNLVFVRRRRIINNISYLGWGTYHPLVGFTDALVQSGQVQLLFLNDFRVYNFCEVDTIPELYAL
jgi:hypothetical protein